MELNIFGQRIEIDNSVVLIAGGIGLIICQQAAVITSSIQTHQKIFEGNRPLTLEEHQALNTPILTLFTIEIGEILIDKAATAAVGENWYQQAEEAILGETRTHE